jgi:hypothetical protein
MDVLEKKQTDRDKLGELITACVSQKVVKVEEVGEALGEILPEVDELQMDIPMIGKYVAKFCALYLNAGGDFPALLPGFKALAESNKALKLVLQMLGFYKELQSAEVARECLSGLELKEFVASYIPPEEVDEEVANAIKSGDAEWLVPLLGCQEYLKSAYAEGTSSQEMIGWIQQHVAEDLRKGAKFAHIMMRAILDHAEATKNTSELKTYSPVMQSFFHTDQPVDTPIGKAMLAQQLQCLFEVQLYCYEREFRDRLLENLFSALYQQDIIEEDAFLAWSEDQEDTTPGKQKAVMSSSKFITWLEEEAEEESEEDED